MNPKDAELVAEAGGNHYERDMWLYAGPEREVAMIPEEAAPEWVAFFKAAPDMARALLAHGQVDVRGVWHSRKCMALGRENLCSDECKMDRAALKKAGVLP